MSTESGVSHKEQRARGTITFHLASGRKEKQLHIYNLERGASFAPRYDNKKRKGNRTSIRIGRDGKV